MSQPASQVNSLPTIETVLVGARPPLAASAGRVADAQVGKWRSIEGRIAAWAPTEGEPDERIDEDGYRLPSRKAVALALEIVVRLRDGGVTCPEWVVQDGNGGIDFEWRGGNRAETLSMNADGEIELMRFENSKLIMRRPVSLVLARG